MANNKNKNNFKERLKKANHPLKHIPKRDLLITLLSILICVLIGFGSGFACAKSCKRVEASADVLSVPARPPDGVDDSYNGGYQYVFNYYLGSYLFTANFVFYKNYNSTYLTTTHTLALADNNNYSPLTYVTDQLYQYTSEEEGYCIDFAPGDTNVEYEIYYTYINAEEYEAGYLYDEDSYSNSYSVLSWSNLAEGGFNGKFSHFVTFYYGFGFVLENGSWWGVKLANGSTAEFSYYLIQGLGTVYTYKDIFGIDTTDSIFQAGYDVGKAEGEDIGYQLGKADGKAEGETIGYLRGRQEGEDIGYNKGIGEKLSNITPWQHIVNGVNSFLAIEIFPGVSFSLIVQLAFGLVLLGIVWKTFLGG